MKRFLLAAALFLICTLPAAAQVVGAPCAPNEVGTTKMVANQENIVACLREGGQFIWKNMSITKPPCRVCIQFVDRGGSGQIGNWECTPYGGGLSNFAFDANRYDPDGARVSFDCQ